MLTAYPTGTALALFLRDAGLTPPLDLPGAVKAGIQAFERDCDRHFLAGKTIENATIGLDGTETRRFDPTWRSSTWGGAWGGGGLMDFGPYGDIVEPPAVVWVPAPGHSEPLTYGSDYLPEPVNAPSMGMPYTGLRLRGRFLGAFGTWGFSGPGPALSQLEVTGRWGYGLSIPADAWRGMVLRAASLAVTQISTTTANASGGLSSWKEADVSEDYAIGPLTTALASARTAWQMEDAAAVNAYRRVSL